MALKNGQLAASALMTPAEVSAAVSASPLGLSAAGLALYPSSLVELGDSAILYDRLMGAADWDDLPAALRQSWRCRSGFLRASSLRWRGNNVRHCARLGGPGCSLRRSVALGQQAGAGPVPAASGARAWGGFMIVFPPEISVVSVLASNDSWWLGPAAVGALGAKTANWTGIAQHNILSRNSWGK